MKEITVEVIKTVKGYKKVIVLDYRDIMNYGFVEDIEVFGEGIVWDEIELIAVDKISNQDGQPIAFCYTDEDGKRDVIAFESDLE